MEILLVLAGIAVLTIIVLATAVKIVPQAVARIDTAMRALEADPDNLEACTRKMNFLEPRWFGSNAELLSLVPSVGAHVACETADQECAEDEARRDQASEPESCHGEVDQTVPTDVTHTRWSARRETI